MAEQSVNPESIQNLIRYGKHYAALDEARLYMAQDIIYEVGPQDLPYLLIGIIGASRAGIGTAFNAGVRIGAIKTLTDLGLM